MTLDGGKYKGISSKFVYESMIVNCVLDSLLSCRCGSTKIHASHPAPLLRPDTSKTGGLGVGTSLSQASNIELKSRGVARGVPGDGLSPKTRVGLESIPPCSGTTSGVSSRSIHLQLLGLWALDWCLSRGDHCCRSFHRLLWSHRQSVTWAMERMDEENSFY